MSLIGDDKRTVCIGPVAWLATHGYVPKKEETDEKCERGLTEGMDAGGLLQGLTSLGKRRSATVYEGT